MSTVNSVDIIDGNQYLINSLDNTVNNDSSESFDDVFNSQSKTLEDIFQQVSKEYDVPVRLLKAVAQAESSFDTNAVSSCGASGIMQLMPQTAKSLGVEDVFDAEQNITGGAKMLAYLLDDYGGNTTLALAAYNAGSGAVSKYDGVPPYAETQNYIKKINDILGGELEADTTNISIEKKAANQADTSGSSVSGTYKITTPSSTDSTTSELFSYEDYLKFLDMYQTILDKLFSSEDENEEKSDKANNDSSVQSSQNEQQSLYEIQQAMYNPLAVSLLDL